MKPPLKTRAPQEAGPHYRKRCSTAPLLPCGQLSCTPTTNPTVLLLAVTPGDRGGVTTPRRQGWQGCAGRDPKAWHAACFAMPESMCHIRKSSARWG